MRSRVIWSVVAILLLMWEPGRTTQNTASTLPGRLEAYLTKTVKVTPDQRQRLLKGEPLVTLLPGDDTKEVGVLGAIWINASIHSYVAGVKDIENFEKGGGFKVTKRISTPPRLEDFALLSLPDDDLHDLRSCQVGDCELWPSSTSPTTSRGETPGWRSIAMHRVRRSWLTSSAA